MRLITQEQGWSELDNVGLTRMLDDMTNVGETQLLGSQVVAPPVATIDPRHTINAGPTQDREGEPGTTSAGQHHFNPDNYYSPQDILDSQPSFVPPTELDNNFWDGIPPYEVNSMIIY